MGIITVNIIVNNIGADTGPFDIYDDYTGLLIVNVTKQELTTGVTLDIDDAATQITVLSKGICNNNLIVPITTFPLSPTPSATPSISVTRTPSITPSISLTPSETPSLTPSITVSPSIIISRTPSHTPTNSVTPSITPSNSVTPSITPTTSVSSTPSITPTVTVSNTPTTSVSSTPSITPSITPSATPGASISISRTPSVTPSITATPSITPSVTRTPTVTPTPSSFPTLFLGLTTAGVNDACTNGELPGYTWILGNRSDTTLCNTSFVRNTSSSILSTIGIGNFFWLRQGSSTRKFQVDLFSFGEFAGELYGMAVESCAICPSISATPSISPTQTPTQTPSITPSATPPCCTYYDIGISSNDTDNATGNTSYENGVVYVNYTDCYDQAQSLGLIPGIYTNQICVKPLATVNLVYYQNDNPSVVSFSSASQEGCCSPYPPPSFSPTPTLSVTSTPTPSVSVGASSSPTPTLTPTPSTTPASPTAFTFTDTFVGSTLLDCDGEGNLAIITNREYEIILRDNCVNQNILAAQATQNFVVSINCTSGTITDNIAITGGNSAYSNVYESANNCTGNFCNVSLTNSPGTLTQC